MKVRGTARNCTWRSREKLGDDEELSKATQRKVQPTGWAYRSDLVVPQAPGRPGTRYRSTACRQMERFISSSPKARVRCTTARFPDSLAVCIGSLGGFCVHDNAS